MAFKMKNPSMAKMVKAAGDNRAAMKMKMEEKAAAAKMKKEAAMKMKKESAMKMDKESMAKLKEKASAMKMKKSPMEKELVGKQHNLPEELKAKIEAAPSKMKKSAMKKKKDGDNRSLFQKAKDEGKQILKGVKAGSDALDRNLQSGMQNSESPIAEAKKAYKRQEKKDRAAGNKKSPSKMRNRKGAMETESPMKKDGTKFTDKVKSAGRALKDNLFKRAGHGDIHNTLTRKISRSYKEYKKGYREADEKKAPTKMKKGEPMKMSHKK